MKTYRRLLLAVLFTWAATVAAVGCFPLLENAPAFLVPALVAFLSVSLSMAILRVAWLKDAVGSWGVKGILAAHLGRFVGLYFIWLHARGRLPAEFAQRAGWGDVATAAAAGLLLLGRNGPGFSRALLAWNVVGALDLFVAVGTAGYLNFRHPGIMSEMVRFPLVLVPLFFVPVYLASHLYLLRQTRSGRPTSRGEIAAA